jgi:hypothetical protein
VKVELCLLTCTCSTPCCEVDVGVGPWMTCGSQHCKVHGHLFQPGQVVWKNKNYGDKQH